MAKVFIGVGHGGTDSGAVGKNGQLEKALNLSIAKACGAALERHGVKVKLSRTKDENDPVNEEVAECNSFAPDLAVDIHNNAGGGTGAETFYTIGGGTGKKLAENILAQLAAIGHRSRGAKTRTTVSGSDYYAFIRNTKAPAVIVECAFVDSNDIERIDTDPLSVGSHTYDFVMDGYEAGGGGMRIHNAELQMRVLKLLGFTEERAKEQFGFLMEALELGAPPMGGFALGLDRVCMLLAGADSIREVMAFPKTSNGNDLMSDAPSPVSARQLKEVSLRVD
jgi:hypothetical protein